MKTAKWAVILTLTGGTHPPRTQPHSYFYRLHYYSFSLHLLLSPSLPHHRLSLPTPPPLLPSHMSRLWNKCLSDLGRGLTRAGFINSCTCWHCKDWNSTVIQACCNIVHCQKEKGANVLPTVATKSGHQMATSLVHIFSCPRIPYYILFLT